VHASDAVSLLILALGAFAIPLLMGRIGIPSAVGEILFGVLIGPHALGLIHQNEFTTFLAEFGFAILMFLVGLELDFPRIERAGIKGIVMASGVAVLIFVVSLGITLWMGQPLYLFIAFGAVSVGILLVTISELGLTKTPAGQTMIFVGSLGEFFTIILLTAFGLYYEFGFGLHLVIEMAKLGSIFGAAYVMLVVLRTLIWWFPHKFGRVVATRDPSEIGVRAGMAMMLIFVALATLMGIEAILGAFIAGALFSFVFREKGILETKLSSIGFGFFVPVFFIWVGTEFNLEAVMRVDILPLLGLFLFASLATKIIATLPLLLQGMKLREVLGAGVIFSAPLTLLVVIARIGEEVKVIDETTSGALVLLAIVSSVVLPAIFRIMMRTKNAVPAASTRR
jgi:Kef-type K+ transport system membrane component KefB